MRAGRRDNILPSSARLDGDAPNFGPLIKVVRSVAQFLISTETDGSQSDGESSALKVRMNPVWVPFDAHVQPAVRRSDAPE